ncbi:MAG: sigma-70 family RNA polymerase sigma factor [Acidimicrobiales bacterium]
MTYVMAPARVGPVSWQHRWTSTAHKRDELWARYLSERRTADRTELVESYLSLVGFVVSRLKGILPRHVERDRLTQYGVFGLIDAIERFDPGRQARFETFAVPRIRGSILDAVRATDWAPRSVRARARALADAAVTLEARLRRAPNNEELREELGLSHAAFDALTADVLRSDVTELDDRAHDLAADCGDPAEEFERAEESRLLRKCIASLPAREQRVLVLYYFEDRTLKEIGALLGVSESWVCKVHAKAMRTVCAKLRPAG